MRDEGSGQALHQTAAREGGNRQEQRQVRGRHIMHCVRHELPHVELWMAVGSGGGVCLEHEGARGSVRENNRPACTERVRHRGRDGR